MHDQRSYQYAENKELHIQIAHIPYKTSEKGERFVFTVVLPNKGVNLDDVEKKLNSNSQLRQKLLSHQNSTSQELDLYLPKFRLEMTYELGDILAGLGMKDAFDKEKADFEGMVGKVTNNNRISISKVKTS